MNFGERAFVNVPQHLRIMAERIRAAGAKPELEVFDAGHVELARHLVDEGLIDAPPMFQLCLGIPWGAPATPEAMQVMRSHLPEGGQQRLRELASDVATAHDRPLADGRRGSG
jgi:uncharacterized protein (DUF849 family)